MFSYLAAGAEKSSTNQKTVATTPQPSPMFVPMLSSCMAPLSPQDDSEDTSYQKAATAPVKTEKTKAQISSNPYIPPVPNQTQTSTVRAAEGPPAYPPPALPPGVQPPAPPPGNIRPLSGVPQVPPGRPGKPPPIPHRSSLTRQPSTPPPPPRPK